MIKSAIASLSLLAMSASTFAGDITPTGDTLSMPALAMIGAIGLIAGVRYLRNKRS